MKETWIFFIIFLFVISAAPKVFGIYYKIFSCLFSYFLIIKLVAVCFFVIFLLLTCFGCKKNGLLCLLWKLFFSSQIIINFVQFWDFICVVEFRNFVLNFIYKFLLFCWNCIKSNDYLQLRSLFSWFILCLNVQRTNYN